MDSTEKIRQRWLDTLRGQKGDSNLLRALACWCYFVLQTELPIDDPRAEALQALREADEPLAERLPAALELVGINRAQNWLGEDRLALLSGYLNTLESY